MNSALLFWKGLYIRTVSDVNDAAGGMVCYMWFLKRPAKMGTELNCRTGTGDAAQYNIDLVRSVSGADNKSFLRGKGQYAKIISNNGF